MICIRELNGLLKFCGGGYAVAVAVFEYLKCYIFGHINSNEIFVKII